MDAGERVVFLPYAEETFAATQAWIHARGIFDEAPNTISGRPSAAEAPGAGLMGGEISFRAQRSVVRLAAKPIGALGGPLAGSGADFARPILVSPAALRTENPLGLVARYRREGA